MKVVMITIAIILLIIKWIRQNWSDADIVARLVARGIDVGVAKRLVKILRSNIK